MGKHISDRFHSCYTIISSDEDQPSSTDIYVGFTMRGELAISIDLTDYEEPWFNASTAAIVNIDDARRMAKRHNIKYEDLPLFICECMEEDWGGIINPTGREVKACFKEITECLLDERCRFKIIRTYGKRGHRCC